MSHDPDEDRVQCHLCGGWFRQVGGAHLTRVHGWTVEEYREAFHLPKLTPTCSRGVSERKSEVDLEMIAAGSRFAAVDTSRKARESRRGGVRSPRWRSLAYQRPDLLPELHPSRNGELDPFAVGPGSDRRLWWRCSEGHEWQASVSHRASGRGCPACARARRAAENRARLERELRAAPERSLAGSPALAAELHPTRNGGLDAWLVSARSTRKLWWRCAKGHVWQATVSNRSQGTGCPVCARRRARENRGRVTPERSLAAMHPELVAELHPSRNRGLDPWQVASGSPVKVWWRCVEGHEWRTTISTRCAEHGCPTCGRQRGAEVRKQRRPRVVAERSLAVLRPDLAAELHPTRNGILDAHSLTPGSNRRVWWQCAQGHEWLARVAHRAGGTGCLACRRATVKYPAEVVIAALREDAARLGRPPRVNDWHTRPLGVPGVGAVRDRFGTWGAGLRAAGLEVYHGRAWSREEVIAALRVDADRRGRPPRQSDWRAATATGLTASVVQRLFGSWNLGLEAADLAVSSQPGKWTRETVLEALRRRERELGRPPTASEMAAPGPGYPTATIVARKLGSWSEARKALGWPTESLGSRGDQPMLAALRAAGWELSGPLTETAYDRLAQERGWPSAAQIKKRFATWTAAKHASTAVGKVVIWSEDEIAAALRAGCRAFGRAPTWSEWKKLASARRWPSATMLTNRYGGWDEVLAVAGITAAGR